MDVDKCRIQTTYCVWHIYLTFFFVGDGIDLPYQVDISNCDVQPCQVPRGTDATLQIDFFARKYYNRIIQNPSSNFILYTAYYIESFSPKAVAYFAGVPINYPLTSQKIGCDYLVNTRCPLEEDEYVSYILKLPILPVFPLVCLQFFSFHIHFLFNFCYR